MTRKKGQATIKDIARRLHISVSTVSRALHDHPDISAATKKQVRTLATELDYHPDGIAQSLKSKRTSTIGVIVPEIRHEFFASALNGIEDVTYDSGYTIMVCKSNESYEREVVNTRALVSNRVAGVIASISQGTQDVSHFVSLQKRGVPLVFFDRVHAEISASRVTVDDKAGAFAAVSHLLDCGYSRIAHLGGPVQLSNSNERFGGYRAALASHGVHLDEALVVRRGFQEEDGVLGMQALLRLNPRPDAVFAVNDPVAIGAFIQLKENGLKIPQDVALVGFSDNPICSLLEPALTTVAQPAYEMGVAAARLLLDQIEQPNQHNPVTTKILETKLIVRQSTVLPGQN